MKFKLLGLLFLIMLVGLGVYISLSFRKFDNTPVVCSQEALQCPDGSFVSRTGAQCTFIPCPSMEFVEGTLEQNGTDFRLVTSSPGENPQEVAYALPLRVEASTAAGALLNKKVRVYGIFTEGNTLAVDRVQALPGDQGDPTLGTVQVGETVFVNGVRITLNTITQDSRCPADVVCIQAGWVSANVTLRSNTDTDTRDIATNQAPLAFDSYHISIDEVTPAKVSRVEIQPAQYRLTFKVVPTTQSF